MWVARKPIGPLVIDQWGDLLSLMSEWEILRAQSKSSGSKTK